MDEQVRGVLLEGEVADLVDDDLPVAPQPGQLGGEPAGAVGVGEAGDPVGAVARFAIRRGPLYGSAFVPVDREWRYVSGYEHVDDCAGLLVSGGSGCWRVWH